MEGNMVDLEKKIVEIEVECEVLKGEKLKLEKEVAEVKGKEEKTKGKYAQVKNKLDSEKRKWGEEEEAIRKKCRQLEVDKRKLEIDLIRAAATTASAERPKSSLVERDGRTAELWAKIESLGSEKKQMLEQVSKMTKEKNAAAELNRRALEAEKKRCSQLECYLRAAAVRQNKELTQRIGVLVSEKMQMLAQSNKMNKEKNDEAERNRKALEAEKKRCSQLEYDLKAAAVTVSENKELVQRIRVLEKDKEQMVVEMDAAKKKALEAERAMVTRKMSWREVLISRVEKLEPPFRKVYTDIEEACEEMSALKEQVEKAVSERDEAIRDCQDSKARQTQLEKDNTKIRMALKEKMALLETREKVISEKLDVIRVLNQENEMLEARNKEFKMKELKMVLKREEDVA